MKTILAVEAFFQPIDDHWSLDWSHGEGETQQHVVPCPPDERITFDLFQVCMTFGRKVSLSHPISIEHQARNNARLPR